MDEKTTGIVSYLWWVGLVIVIITRKEKTEYTSFHIRQSLGLLVLSFLGGILYYIPKIGYMLGGIVGLILFVLWIIAFIGALNNERKLVPIVGDKFQEWFKSM